MNKIDLKRFLAFAIDMVLVLVVVSMISNIRFINPNVSKYNDYYKKTITLADKYQKKEITQKEYQEKYNKLYYQMEKYNVSTNIVSFIVIGSYFILLPYFNKGQTLGKKITNIKIKANKGKKVKFINYFVRSLILNYLWLYPIRLILLYSLSSNNFYYIMNKVQIFGTLTIYVCGCMILFSQDRRGLHDICANTKVVDSSDNSEEEVVLIKKNK